MLLLEYWDHSLWFLPLTMFIGWTILSTANWRAKRQRPLLIAFLAVIPWGFGLAGVPYLGFLFLALEVLLSGCVLGFAYRRAGLTMPVAIVWAAVARAISLFPVLV